MINSGFTRGIASPCVFHHKTRGIRILVHGDDYVSVGMLAQLKWMEGQRMKKYQIKTQLLGPGEGQSKELKILNRIATWSGSRGVTHEAGPRHVEIVVEQLRLSESKPVAIFLARKRKAPPNKMRKNHSATREFRSTGFW